MAKTGQKQKGVTLIELMVVVAVLTILSMIVYPLYVQQITKVKREAARDALTETAQRLERCYSQFLAYNHASCTVPTNFEAPTDSTDKRYQITAVVNAGNYTLTATAINQQLANDPGCTTFTLTNLGVTTGCW